MSRNWLGRSRLGLETLEARRMMTFVTTLVGTTLFITEDAANTDNSIDITQNAAHTTTSVTGVNDVNGLATTVDGVANGTSNHVGVVNIIVTCLSGEHRVGIGDTDGFVLTGGFIINLGASNGANGDGVTIFLGNLTAAQQVQVNGDFQVMQQDNIGFALLDNLAVFGDLSVSLGNGADTFSAGTRNVAGFAALPVAVAGNTNVSLGGDADDFFADGLFVGGSFSVTGGTGDDDLEFGDAIAGNIDLSAPVTPALGVNHATNRNGPSLGGVFTVDTGAGNDDVRINRFTGGQTASISLGADQVGSTGGLILRNSSFGSPTSSGTITIIGGTGVDFVDIDAVNTYGDLNVATGDSAGDQISLIGVLVEVGSANLSGGAGIDAILVSNCRIRRLTLECQADHALVQANVLQDFFADYGTGGGSASFNSNLITGRAFARTVQNTTTNNSVDFTLPNFDEEGF